MPLAQEGGDNAQVAKKEKGSPDLRGGGVLGRGGGWEWIVDGDWGEK